MISHMISWSCIYDIKITWYHRSMISEQISQTFVCNIRKIKYDMMARCLYPSPKMRSKSRSAGSSAGCSKSATVI